MAIVILHAHIQKTYIQKIHTAYNERDIIIVSYAYSKMPSIHIYTTITHATKHQTSPTHTQRARTHTLVEELSISGTLCCSSPSTENILKLS